MFKVFKGISPQILKEIFQFKDAVPYQLRLQIDLQISLSKEIILLKENESFQSLAEMKTTLNALQARHTISASSLKKQGPSKNKKN